MVLVVPPGHRLADAAAVMQSDLKGENYVGFTTELTIRRKIDGWLRKARVPVNIIHEFDNIEHIKRAVEIGSGIAILPAPTVQRENENGSLCVRSLVDADWSRPLGIIHRRNKSMTTPVDRFIELLHEDPATFSTAGCASSFALCDGDSGLLVKNNGQLQRDDEE